jgi:hypothetical protein
VLASHLSIKRLNYLFLTVNLLTGRYTHNEYRLTLCLELAVKLTHQSFTMRLQSVLAAAQCYFTSCEAETGLSNQTKNIVR